MSGGRPWREKACPWCHKRFSVPGGKQFDRIHCSRECKNSAHGERTHRLFEAAKRIGV